MSSAALSRSDARSESPRIARAVGLTEFGGTDVLSVIRRPVADPDEGEVLIRVGAAAVNPTDINFRTGARAALLSELPPPYTPGMDAAGTVEALGPGVSRLAVGDRVMAAVNPCTPAGGAQSELLVAPAGSVVSAPSTASIEEAATLPMNGLTALQALDLLDIPPRGTMAITGGTGWLATLATVLAKERGIRVITDAPAAELDDVKRYGADHVVERGRGVVERMLAIAPDGVDGLLDAALIGPELLGAIREGGGWAVVRGQQDETERGIVRHNVAVVDRLQDTEAFLGLARLAEQGRLPMRVAKAYTVEEVADAHRCLEAGGVRGRLVLTFA